MTDPIREQALRATEDRTTRILAIAAALAATGVATGTNGDHLTGLDVTATDCPPGRAKTEIMLDEDGYAALARVLTAITAAPSVLAPAPPPC
jgi:hypothetical protein